MSRFAVALSGDFQNSDGSPALADFDLTPLTESTAVSVEYVQPLDGVMPASGLEGFDALILLQPRFGAGLDVFEIEPAPADGPLFALDNVICTPHALCWTDECFRLNGEADVQAVLDLMQGRVPRGIVHRGIVDNRDWQRKLVGFKSRFGADPER